MEPYDLYSHLYLLIKYFGEKTERTSEESKLSAMCHTLSDLYNRGV